MFLPLSNTFAVDPDQPSAFEPQVLIHPVIRAVNPFPDLHLVDLPEMIDRLFIANDVLADRLAALLLNFEHPVAGADQLTSTSQSVGLA